MDYIKPVCGVCIFFGLYYSYNLVVEQNIFAHYFFVVMVVPEEPVVERQAVGQVLKI